MAFSSSSFFSFSFAMAEDPLSSLGGVILEWKASFLRKYQILEDKSVPDLFCRWMGSATIACLYCLRIYFTQAFHIVTYGLGIYILNLFISFLSPQVDPESEGPTLPSRNTDEFKPFVRRLPEFKFWYAMTRALCVAVVMTFFSVFDIPVFWPILLMYWMVLFMLIMKRQIKHMIKYKYLPFSIGKPRYKGKDSISDQASSSRD